MREEHFSPSNRSAIPKISKGQNVLDGVQNGVVSVRSGERIDGRAESPRQIAGLVYSELVRPG
jgi:hypothetical protein